MIRLALVLMLLGGMATAQEHPRTFHDGRGRPSQSALNEPDVPAATPRWRLDIRGALRRETWSPGRGSFLDPHVLSDARRLFYIREGKLHAVEAKIGRQLWTLGVGEGARLEVGAGGLVIVADKRSVHGLDARTGRVRWQHPYRAPEGVETFAVHEDLLTVIVGERLIAYELATGREHWRVRGLAGLTYHPHHTVLSASGSVVFLELSYHSLTSSPDVFAFDRATGERLWKVWSHFSTLAVVGNRVYLLEDDHNMDHDYPGRFKVNAFDLRSGKPLDKDIFNLNRAAVSNNPGAHPSPWEDGRKLVYEDTLYVEAKRLGTAHANVARFALGSQGTSRSAFVKPGANLEWLAGPYQDKLFVLEREGGKRRFRVGDVGGSSLSPIRFDDTYQIGANPISRLDLIGDGLYVGHTDGRFVAVNVQTGRVFFHVQTDAKNFGPTHVVGDMLIVQAGDELLVFTLPKELNP